MDCEKDGGESTARQVSFGRDAASRSPESELQHGTFALVRIRTATFGNVNDLLAILADCRNLLQNYSFPWGELDNLELYSH